MLNPWTSKQAHACTVSPMTTCCTLYDTISEHSKPTIRLSRCSIGPSMRAEPLEVGLVNDDEGAAIIHAMKAREKFLRGWWTK